MDELDDCVVFYEIVGVEDDYVIIGCVKFFDLVGDIVGFLCGIVGVMLVV